MGFLVPVFSRIMTKSTILPLNRKKRVRTKSTILPLNRKKRVRENPYFGLFYAVYYKIIIVKLFTRHTTLMINHKKIHIGSWIDVIALVYYIMEPLTGRLVSIPFLFVLLQMMVLCIKFHI